MRTDKHELKPQSRESEDWNIHSSPTIWSSFLWLLKKSGPWSPTAHLVIIPLTIGIASVILWSIHPDARVPVLGALFGLILLTIVRLLHALQREPSKSWRIPAQVFLWFCMLFFMAATGVLGSALLLGAPRSTREILDHAWPTSISGVSPVTAVGIPGFQINRSERELDLRAVRPILPGHEKEAISKGVWRNTFFVKRMRADGNDFVIPYGTSGVRADVVSTTDPFKLIVSGPGASRQSGPLLRTRGELHIDLSEIPLDVEKPVKEEAAYWNAFQGATHDWAAVRTTYQEGSIDFNILFPPNKPCKRYTLSAYSNTDNKQYERVNGDVHLSSDGLKLQWHIPASQLNYCYRIDWDW